MFRERPIQNSALDFFSPIVERPNQVHNPSAAGPLVHIRHGRFAMAAAFILINVRTHGPLE